MDTEVIFKKITSDMQKSVDHVLSEFATLHTGKANPRWSKELQLMSTDPL